MADDVTLPLTGSGDATAKVATDEHATKGHIQLVKLAYSADGDGTHITADASGLEVQLGAALPAGTNNIGDVDVLTVPAPLSTTGGGTEAAALRVTIANNSTGLVSVDDNGGSLTVDGTVTADAGTGPWPVTDNGGSLTIDAASLPLPTGAATAANQSTGNGHLSTLAGAVSGTEMQVDVLTSALPSGAATAANQATGNTNTTDLPNVIGTDGSAGPTKALSVAGTESDGTLQELRVDNDGHLQVDVLSGTNVAVVGNVTHDSADSGAPVKLGAKAVNLKATPTAVATSDRTDLLATRAGQLFTIGGHPNAITRSVLVTDANGSQTGQTIVASVASGTAVVVTRVTVLCDNANTADVSVQVGFSTTTTMPSPSTTGVDGLLVDHRGIPAGGGVTVGDGSGIIGIGASDEELRYSCDDPAGGNVTVTVTYYTISV